MIETSIKTYATAKEYEKGLRAMMLAGWTSTNVVEKRPVRGCLALFPARSELIVTYQRDRANVPIQEVMLRNGGCPYCRAAVTPTAFFCPTCGKQLRT